MKVEEFLNADNEGRKYVNDKGEEYKLVTRVIWGRDCDKNSFETKETSLVLVNKEYEEIGLMYTTDEIADMEFEEVECF